MKNNYQIIKYLLFLFFVFYYKFRMAIESLSKQSSASLRITDSRQSIKQHILIVCLWFFSTLAGAIFLPNISVAIHYLGALAASFIFIFPGLFEKVDDWSKK